MTKAKVNELGSLCLILNESSNGVVMSSRLDSGAEVEYDNDKILAIILPNFEQQLNRGDLSDVDIVVKYITMEDDLILFVLDINSQIVNGRISISSSNL